MYEAFIKSYFWWCVELLQDIADGLGVTYEELNVWVFVVIHPLITVGLLFWVIRLRRRLRRRVKRRFRVRNWLRWLRRR